MTREKERPRSITPNRTESTEKPCKKESDDIMEDIGKECARHVREAVNELQSMLGLKIIRGDFEITIDLTEVDKRFRDMSKGSATVKLRGELETK